MNGNGLDKLTATFMWWNK